MKRENLQESITIVELISRLENIKRDGHYIAHNKNVTIGKNSNIDKYLSGEYQKAIDTINSIATLLIINACEKEIEELNKKLEQL